MHVYVSDDNTSYYDAFPIYPLSHQTHCILKFGTAIIFSCFMCKHRYTSPVCHVKCMSKHIHQIQPRPDKTRQSTLLYVIILSNSKFMFWTPGVILVNQMHVPVENKEQSRIH